MQIYKCRHIPGVTQGGWRSSARDRGSRPRGGGSPTITVHSHHLFEMTQVAVYWLLRSAEQGQLEARETLVALAGEGRGLTEQNYVDVAAVVRVAPNHAEDM